MENSIVRENLINQEGYSPYCGKTNCSSDMPRAKWDKKLNQFRCSCGWVSEFPKEFIDRYIKKWNLKTPNK